MNRKVNAYYLIKDNNKREASFYTEVEDPFETFYGFLNEVIEFVSDDLIKIGEKTYEFRTENLSDLKLVSKTGFVEKLRFADFELNSNGEVIPYNSKKYHADHFKVFFHENEKPVEYVMACAMRTLDERKDLVNLNSEIFLQVICSLNQFTMKFPGISYVYQFSEWIHPEKNIGHAETEILLSLLRPLDTIDDVVRVDKFLPLKNSNQLEFYGEYKTEGITVRYYPDLDRSIVTDPDRSTYYGKFEVAVPVLFEALT